MGKGLRTFLIILCITGFGTFSFAAYKVYDTGFSHPNSSPQAAQETHTPDQGKNSATDSVVDNPVGISYRVKRAIIEGIPSLGSDLRSWGSYPGTCEVSYNDSGKMVSKTLTGTDGEVKQEWHWSYYSDGTRQSELLYRNTTDFRDERQYNEQGDEVYWIQEGVNGLVSESNSTYVYDELGRPIECHTVLTGAGGVVVDEQTKTWSRTETSVTQNIYHSYSGMTETYTSIIGDEDGLTSRENDANGRLASAINLSGNTLVYTWSADGGSYIEKEYSSDGALVCTTQGFIGSDRKMYASDINSNDTNLSVRHNDYDSAGNLIRTSVEYDKPDQTHEPYSIRFEYELVP